MTFRRFAVPAVLLGLVAAVVLAACSVSVSTAHLNPVQVGASDGFTTETTTFGGTDTIYARADAANLPNPVTVSWQLQAENVQGQQPNTPIPAADQTFNLQSDATTSVSITPPTNGWPAGTYKLIVTMTDNGTQRDQKTREFTVR